ncbi:MAG: hypothetical protein KGM43_19215, partial [Planctomycetota bacterium]|nr:hypothetical protein [Planctomycetota bacterium]
MTAPQPAKASDAQPLDADELRKLHDYWSAANYLCIGMIYLKENPLLKQPLALEHIKARL